MTLSATGLTPIHDRSGVQQRLTSAELAVARLVAEGRSNREVTADLVGLQCEPQVALPIVEHDTFLDIARPAIERAAVIARAGLLTAYD
jgi:hypothetical protein